jgi:hypothetical protein
VPCAPTCSTTDVVAGLAQLSDQLHNLSAFVFVAATFFIFHLVFVVALLFVNGRTR